MGVVVDRERLAWELEEGIDQSGCCWVYPRKYILRNPVCGLTSASIAEHLHRREIPVRLIESGPNLVFDEDTAHILPILGEGENQHVIDATATQFLGYVGLVWGYAEEYGEDSYSAEKVIDFKLSNWHEVIDWLTRYAIDFRSRDPRREFTTSYGNKIGNGPLSDSAEEDIRNAYSKIYNPAGFEEYAPSNIVKSAAESVAKFITAGSIQVS